MEKEKRLYRSQRDRVIAGVCGGLGNYFGIDPVLMRIIFVALGICTGFFPFLIIYIAMAVMVPLEGKPYQEPHQTIREGVDELRGTVTELGKDVRDTFSKTSGTEDERETARRRRGYYLGLIVVIIGVVILIANFIGFSWWKFFWPALIIAIGLIILVSASRR